MTHLVENCKSCVVLSDNRHLLLVRFDVNNPASLVLVIVSFL